MTADWCAPAIEALTRLWGMGWSGSRIADFLNTAPYGGAFSRSGVIAKARRVGLEPRQSPIVRLDPAERDRRERARNERRAEQRRLMARQSGFDFDHVGVNTTPNDKREPRSRRSIESRPAVVDIGPRPVSRTVPKDGGTTTLAAAKPHQCRWITGAVRGGDTMICGAPVHHPDASWCQTHHARVFVKRTPSEQRAGEAA